MFLFATFCAVSIAIDGIFMLIDPGLYRRCFAYLGEWFGGAWLPVYGLGFCMMGAVLGLSLRYIGVPAIYCTAGVVLVISVCVLCSCGPSGLIGLPRGGLIALRGCTGWAASYSFCLALWSYKGWPCFKYPDTAKLWARHLEVDQGIACTAFSYCRRSDQSR